MTLGLEIVAILALGWALRVGLGAPAARTVALLGVVVAGLAFWVGVGPRSVNLIRAHDADARLSAAHANTAGGDASFGHVNNGFLAFAAARIPAASRVFVQCGASVDGQGCGSQIDWFGFRLTPRVFVATPAGAQWAIFYRAEPSSDGFASTWIVSRYSRDFSIAHAPR